LGGIAKAKRKEVINETIQSKRVENIKKTPRKSKIKARRIGDENARAALAGFDKDTRIVGLTNGAFSLISLVSESLKVIGPAHFCISTWSAGFYDISAVQELIESGNLLSVRVVIDRSFKTRLSQYSASLIEVFGEENIRTTNTHSKFVLLENEEWKVVILSSMNLNENKRSENFDIQHDPEVFEMLNSFVDDLFKGQRPGLVGSRTEVDKNFDNLFESSNWDTDFEFE
jgi:hypothetical protein